MWSGGLDNILKSFDINSSTESAHGSHEGAIKCVEYSGECGLVVTGSWDSTVLTLHTNRGKANGMLRDGFQVKIWDPRAPGCQGAHSQPDKVSVSAVHTLWPYLPRA